MDELVAGAAALLEEPELRTWWPAPDAVAPFLEEIAAVRDSPIVLAPLQQQERLRAVLERAARELWPPPVLARRLDGLAYVLAETGRRQPARHALAVAARLRERPDTAADVPFVALLVQRALGSLLARAEARETEERRGALVLTPDEIRARASSRPPHTRG
jgi:hypothetical protein